MYPVNRYGLIASNKSIGITEMAEPINIVLIVNIIGATAFLDNVENMKQSIETVIITGREINAEKINLIITSSSLKNNNPLWYTAKSPPFKIINDKVIV